MLLQRHFQCAGLFVFVKHVTLLVPENNYPLKLQGNNNFLGAVFLLIFCEMFITLKVDLFPTFAAIFQNLKYCYVVQVPFPHRPLCYFCIFIIRSLHIVHENIYMTSCACTRYFLHIFQLSNRGNHGNQGHHSSKVNQFIINTLTSSWVKLGYFGKVRLDQVRIR
jgi:hypothetical protein